MLFKITKSKKYADLAAMFSAIIQNKVYTKNAHTYVSELWLFDWGWYWQCSVGWSHSAGHIAWDSCGRGYIIGSPFGKLSGHFV